MNEPTRVNKMKLKEILEKHDVKEFRDFCMDMPELADKVSRFTEEKISRLMYTMKARQLHFGDLAQEARNFLRKEKLEAYTDKWGKDLQEHVYAMDSYPLCNDCKWFRQTPQLDTHPCMHMGAAPLDVACPGWTPNV